MTARPPLRPDRVRRIGQQSFAFVPHRLLRDGFLASMSHGERSLYLFLALAADRQGVSFYGYDRICAILQLSLEDFIQARNGLIDQDLLAFDGTSFQLLSLPSQPVPVQTVGPLETRRDLEDHDPATIRRTILASLHDARPRT